MTAPATRPPLLVLDVDGVINAYDGLPDSKTMRYEFETQPLSGTVIWHQANIDRINELVDAGRVEPVWCTTWREEANLLGARLGLHGLPWRVLDAEGPYRTWDPTVWWKSIAVAEATKGRDFVWVDDDLGYDVAKWHLDRTDRGRFYPVSPFSRFGIDEFGMESIVEVLDAWRDGHDGEDEYVSFNGQPATFAQWRVVFMHGQLDRIGKTPTPHGIVHTEYQGTRAEPFLTYLSAADTLKNVRKVVTRTVTEARAAHRQLVRELLVEGGERQP